MIIIGNAAKAVFGGNMLPAFLCKHDAKSEKISIAYLS